MGDNKSIADIFQKHFIQANSIIQSSGLEYKNESLLDIIPCMYVIADISAINACKDRAVLFNEVMDWCINNLTNTIEEQTFFQAFFDRRVDFYAEVVRGKRLKAYCLSGADVNNIHPTMRCAIAYMDCLVEPSCLEDYDNSPFVLMDFIKLFNMAEGTMKPFAEVLASLYKSLGEKCSAESAKEKICEEGKTESKLKAKGSSRDLGEKRSCDNKVRTLSILLVIACIGLIFAIASLRIQRNQFEAEMTKKDAEINAASEEIHRAWQLYVETVNDMYSDTYTEPDNNVYSEKAYSSPKMMSISELNSLIDRIRIGEIEGSLSQARYPDLYHTIFEMFRSLPSEFEIWLYLRKVYQFETDQYPLEYFKKQGYTYTGDEIEGWNP